MVMTPQQIIQNFGMASAGFPMPGGVPNSQVVPSNDEIAAIAPAQAPNFNALRDAYQGMMQNSYNQMQGGGFQGGMLNSSYANPWSAQGGASWGPPQPAPAQGAPQQPTATWGGPFSNTNAWGNGS